MAPGARRRGPFRRVLHRARDRGEIRSTIDLELAVDLLTAPSFYRRFVAHRSCGRAYAAAVVDSILAAIGFNES